jgi:hypothetical protein
MISVDSLLYKIDQKLNKLSSNEHQRIQLEDKILALNEAQIKLIKQKVTGTVTNTGLGLDAFKKRYEDLENLVENYDKHELTLTPKSKNYLNQWGASLPELGPQYMFYIDSFILADKGKCKNKRLRVNNDLVKHADVQVLLDNSNYKPSFEYEETFNVLTSDEIIIFTDGTFTPTKLYISYIRYPKKINKIGYVDFDGTPSTDEDCELHAYLEDELLDLTVNALAEYTENVSAAQSSQVRIQTNE